ncbi:MAG: inositol monophosphatase [Actinobacteria bacterium]|nr:inositol monophosphatase [Actinomycetota bacterium]
MTSSGELLELAEKIAKKAGELLMSRPTNFELDQKSGVLDFATQMDHESEKLIVSEILAARPDDSIIGEEGANRKGSSGYTWVIDPIDGTVNYLYGIPGWCISIAIKDEVGYLVGVVHVPSFAMTWSARRGGGASCNGKPLRCNEPVELNRALIATGFAYDIERRKPQAKFIAELLPQIRDVRRMGACAVDICMVASGSVDAHFEAGVNEWDYAAAGLIASEAGAKFSYLKGIWDGEKYFVLTAGPSLFASLAKALAPHGYDLR